MGGDGLRATGATHTNHYAGSDDSPAWTDEVPGAWTRNVSGIDGNFALIVTGTSSTVTGTQVQLSDLHGDVVRHHRRHHGRIQPEHFPI